MIRLDLELDLLGFGSGWKRELHMELLNCLPPLPPLKPRGNHTSLFIEEAQSRHLESSL